MVRLHGAPRFSWVCDAAAGARRRRRVGMGGKAALCVRGGGEAVLSALLECRGGGGLKARMMRRGAARAKMKTAKPQTQPQMFGLFLAPAARAAMVRMVGEHREGPGRLARASETRCTGGFSDHGSVLGVVSQGCRGAARCRAVSQGCSAGVDERARVRLRAARRASGAGPTTRACESVKRGNDGER